MITVDPLIAIVVSVGFAALFAAAAATKLRDLARFQAVLTDYAVIPAVLVPSCSILIVATEIILASMWLAPVVRPLAAGGSSVLLAVYAMAMAVNLARSRRHISCGCGPDDQTLSWALVARNTVFVAAALLVLLPAASRTLGWQDVVVGSVSVAVMIVLERGVSTLITNASQMMAWRR